MAKDPRPRVRASVGLRRISKTTRASRATTGRELRAQFKTLQDNLRKAIRQIKDVAPAALYHAMEPIYDESQILVPVDTRALKKSGFLEVTTFRGNPVIAIGYGKGGKPFYAEYVHEDLDAGHKAPTQAKFLQEPWERQQSKIPNRIAAFMSKTLK